MLLSSTLVQYEQSGLSEGGVDDSGFDGVGEGDWCNAGTLGVTGHDDGANSGEASASNRVDDEQRRRAQQHDASVGVQAGWRNRGSTGGKFDVNRESARALTCAVNSTAAVVPDADNGKQQQGASADRESGQWEGDEVVASAL